jgi:hypothetical protein
MPEGRGFRAGNFVKHIDALNRRFAEALGFVQGTSQSRFKWALSTECFYYLRNHAGESFTRYCWADRVGRVWLLTQWQVPTVFDPDTGVQRPLTEADWWKSFNGTIPFPKRGEYIAHAETALAPGHEPTAEHTAYYIQALDRQMSTTYDQQMQDSLVDLKSIERKRNYDFDCMINEACTRAFDPTGTRSAMVHGGF